MPRTKVRQDTQVWNSEAYDDSIAPTQAAFETNPVDAETDLNNIRSMLNELRSVRNDNWWDALTLPTTFTGDSGIAVRGVQDVAQDLWDTERKRILQRVSVVGASIGPIAVNAQHAVLDAAGELPGNTTIAVGSVNTLGTIAAYAATFDSAQLTEVTGGDALTPYNLAKIIDAATRDPITDGSGREVYGLLQSESNTDGFTATVSSPNRLQISFVVANSTGDDLELAAAGVMDGKTIDYAPVEQFAFGDMPKHAFLGDAFVDAGAGAVNRQQAYNNQGTTPVDLTTNAILDLESAGIYWEIRDDAEATLFRITEGSAGGTSEVAIGSDVDLYDNDAADVDFASGITARSGGTRPIDVGVQDGIIESTAGDLEIQAATELNFDDGNKPVGWSRAAGILLSDTAQEWTDFEAEFGEVSLLNAIVQAKQDMERATQWAHVSTADIAANTLITGAGGSPNISAQMPDYEGLTFVTDVEVFINGIKQRPGADAAANHDVYPSAVAGEQAVGAFYCEYVLRYRGGVNPDNINMVVYGQPL
jgi:hypothetical protein